MELMESIQGRRSIRKYTDRQIPREDLETIVTAGLFAPNAGGRQGTRIIGVRSAKLCAEIGRLNMLRFDRSRLLGSYVSKEQPSTIDDPTITNGLYGAPACCVLFGPRNFRFSVPDAFCCAENIVLAAYSLGIASCIVSRAEETFDNEGGAKLLDEWNIPKDYTARCLISLGYCSTEYPKTRTPRADRARIIEDGAK